MFKHGDCYILDRPHTEKWPTLLKQHLKHTVSWLNMAIVTYSTSLTMEYEPLLLEQHLKHTVLCLNVAIVTYNSDLALEKKNTLNKAALKT